MSNWIGLGVVLFLLACGIALLAHISKPYDVTVEEYERRAQEAPSLLSAGLVGLQKVLDPATEKAVIAQEDLKEGRYDGEQGSGDPPIAGDGQVNEQADNPTSGETDA
jgi:hypothetical protein